MSDSASHKQKPTVQATAPKTKAPAKGSALPQNSENRPALKSKPELASRNFEVRDSGVQTPALDRALALLEFISAHSGGVTTGEVREALGFSANLVFRLTKALSVHGYVERDLSGSRFLLTSKLLTLVQPKREDRSLAQISWETLRALRDSTGESAHIGIRSGFDCVVLERVVGPSLFKYYVEAGARGPLHAGAPGKVMLAWLPEAELELVLSQMELTRLTDATLTSKKTFANHLRAVRANGYAMDMGETMEGLRCLGAPVFDAEGRVCASVWITAPAPRLDAAAEQRHAPLVIAAGRQISGLLR